MISQNIQNLKNFSDPKTWEGVAKELVGPDLGVTFTNYKKYDKAPLNNKEAMEKGLEVFRVLASYWAAQRRGCSTTFLNSGVLIEENFLPNKLHSKVVQEVYKYPLRINKFTNNLIQKNNIIYSAIAEKLYTKIYSCIKINDKDKFRSNTFVQRIHDTSVGHLRENSGEDAQFRIHTDIFSPAIKYWYFPEEVTEDMGPLLYAPKSCSLDDNILNIWYEESVKITSGEYIPDWKQPSHKEGSLRIEEEELNSLGYILEKLVLPANSLVLANVHGFHRRGKGDGKTTRTSIHGSIRVNNPFYVNQY